MPSKEKRTRGTGSIYKRKDGPNYFIAYYGRNGRQVHESSGSPIKAVAERLLRKRLEKVEKGVPVDQARKLRYEDIRDALLTSYRNNVIGIVTRRKGSIHGLAYLDEFFANVKVQSITTPLIDDFVAKLKSGELQRRCRKPTEKRAIKPLQNGSINRILALLRRMMNLAWESSLIHSVPHFPMLAENNVREGFVETDQFKKIIGFLPAHLVPLVVFLYRTGCRIGAALQIEWAMVSGDCTKMFLPGRITKNKKPLPLKLTNDLTAVLRKQFRSGKVFDDTNLRSAWASATKKAGCPGLLIHDLRRSGARNPVDSGTPETVAMKIGGWLTASVFRRYNIVSPRQIDEAMSSLEQNDGALIEEAASAGD